MQKPVKHNQLCLGNQTFTSTTSILNECSQNFVLKGKILATELI